MVESTSISLQIEPFQNTGFKAIEFDTTKNYYFRYISSLDSNAAA